MATTDTKSVAKRKAALKAAEALVAVFANDDYYIVVGEPRLLDKAGGDVYKLHNQDTDVLEGEFRIFPQAVKTAEELSAWLDEERKNFEAKESKKEAEARKRGSH